METINIPIPIPYNSNYETIQKQWKWFRKHLMRIYNVQQLPTSFNKRDGTISENTAIEEDDIMYDMTPAEYNYNWYNQKLEFKYRNHTVSIKIEIADFGSHTSFSYNNEFQESAIKCYFSVYEKHHQLTIHKKSLYKLIWEEALEELKALDDRNYEGI